MESKEEQIKALKTEIETQTRLLNEKSLTFIAEFQEVRYQHQKCSIFFFKKKRELYQQMQALCDEMTNFRIPIELELKRLKEELKSLEVLDEVKPDKAINELEYE